MLLSSIRWWCALTIPVIDIPLLVSISSCLQRENKWNELDKQKTTARWVSNDQSVLNDDENKRRMCRGYSGLEWESFVQKNGKEKGEWERESEKGRERKRERDEEKRQQREEMTVGISTTAVYSNYGHANPIYNIPLFFILLWHQSRPAHSRMILIVRTLRAPTTNSSQVFCFLRFLTDFSYSFAFVYWVHYIVCSSLIGLPRADSYLLTFTRWLWIQTLSTISVVAQ